MQFIATLVTPSSYHLIETSPGPNDVFFTLVKGLIQSIRRRAFLAPKAVRIG